MDKAERVNAFADAAYQATVATHDFLEAEVVPVIHAQVATRPFEEALTGLFYRLVLWGRTLATLGHSNHLQAVRSGARAAFELHLDIHHLETVP